MECIRSNYFNDSFGLLLLILCRVKNYVSYMCNTKNGMLVNLEYANIGASSENPVSSNQSTQPLRVKFEGWGQFYFWYVQPENINNCLSITVQPLFILKIRIYIVSGWLLWNFFQFIRDTFFTIAGGSLLTKLADVQGAAPRLKGFYYIQPSNLTASPCNVFVVIKEPAPLCYWFFLL